MPDEKKKEPKKAENKVELGDLKTPCEQEVQGGNFISGEMQNLRWTKAGTDDAF